MSLPTPSTGSRPLDPKELQAMEGPLMALAQSTGGDLRKLLYAFFSFLHRRTDFYMVPHEDDAHVKMGFREGDAEKVLLAAFRQFPLRKMPRQSEIEAMQQQKNNPTPPAAETPTAPVEKKKEPVKKETPSKKPAQKEPSNEVRYNEEGEQIPVGNGGSTDRYKWTQTIDECSVLIGVGDLRAKDLDVSIKASSITVRAQQPDADGSQKVFVEGELTQKIVPSESTWTLEGGVLVLVLYKQVKTFWETILVGDPKIDTTEVDSRRHIDEYDASTQAQIRKIIFDQTQSRKGLPMSDEILGQQPQDGKLPPLPAGVEYIDQKVLDEHASQSKPSSK